MCDPLYALQTLNNSNLISFLLHLLGVRVCTSSLFCVCCNTSVGGLEGLF